MKRPASLLVVCRLDFRPGHPLTNQTGRNAALVLRQEVALGDIPHVGFPIVLHGLERGVVGSLGQQCASPVPAGVEPRRRGNSHQAVQAVLPAVPNHPFPKQVRNPFDQRRVRAGKTLAERAEGMEQAGPLVRLEMLAHGLELVPNGIAFQRVFQPPQAVGDVEGRRFGSQLAGVNQQRLSDAKGGTLGLQPVPVGMRPLGIAQIERREPADEQLPIRIGRAARDVVQLFRRGRVVAPFDRRQRRADPLAVVVDLDVLVRNLLRMENGLIRQLDQQFGIRFPQARRVARRTRLRQTDQNPQPGQLGLHVGRGDAQLRQFSESTSRLVVQAGLLQLLGPRTVSPLQQLAAFRTGILPKADLGIFQGVLDVAFGQLALCPLEEVKALLDAAVLAFLGHGRLPCSRWDHSSRNIVARLMAASKWEVSGQK